MIQLSRNLTPFKPTKLSGCALWLAADRGVTTVDGKVSAWADQSGNGNHATQSTVANRPLYVASGQNSKPTLSFNGSSQSLNVSSTNGFPSGSSTRTAFVVFNRSSVRANSDFIFSFYAAAQYYAAYNLIVGYPNASSVTQSYWYSIMGSDSLNDTNYRILTTTNTGATTGTTNLYLNGSKLPATVTMGTSGDTINTTYGSYNYIGACLAAGGTPFFAGDISEIIIFNRALSDDERVKVEQYLSSKFAITLS